MQMCLTPGDYVFTGNASGPVTFAFAYADLLDPRLLQRSLRTLQATIPWLAGRLRLESTDSYVFDLGDPPQPALEVVSSGQSFAELSCTDDLVRSVAGRDGEPLMSARLTQTPYGSILGVSMSHALVDGFSFFQSLARWSACTRGESITAPPLQRPLQLTSGAELSAELTPQTLYEQCGLFWRQPRVAPARPPVQERVQLRASEIAQLVETAQRDVDCKLRDNDVVTAWLWRTYGVLQWGVTRDEEVYMTCPVDVRRLLGDANRAVFGCAICFASASASMDELIHAPLGELALRVQRSVAAVFSGSVEARLAPLEALRRRHGLRALESVHVRHPRRGMLVTNMSRLPLEGLDFGCGAPVDFRVFSEFDSMALVLPADDGVAVQVSRANPRAVRGESPPSQPVWGRTGS